MYDFITDQGIHIGSSDGISIALNKKLFLKSLEQLSIEQLELLLQHWKEYEAHIQKGLFKQM